MSLILLTRTPEKFRLSPPLYMSDYYVDLALICTLAILVIVMRRLELNALVMMGVFKDLNSMNDRELFSEYDKMLKQSTKVRK